MTEDRDKTMFSTKKDKIVRFLLPEKRTIVSTEALKRTKCDYFDDISKGHFDDELLDPEDSGAKPRAVPQPDNEADEVEANNSRPRKHDNCQLTSNIAFLSEDGLQPTSNDVLIGPEHGEFIACEGTEKLHRSIFAAQRKYHDCNNYKEKVAVISDIMDSVKMQSPKGRFFKLDASKPCWIEVSDEYACMHVLKLFLTSGDDTTHSLDRSLRDAAPIGSAEDTKSQDDATSTGKPLLSTAKASHRVSHAVIEAAIRASENDHEEIHVPRSKDDEFDVFEGVPIFETSQRTNAHENEEATATTSAYANGEETDSDRTGPPRSSTNDNVPTSANLNRSFDSDSDVDSEDDEEEQVLVSLALFNYETFYGLEHGTAILDTVVASSAGILGWAACSLPVSKQNDDFGEKVEPQPSHSFDAKESPNLPPGDDKEARQLQMALLESLGAHPKNKSSDTFKYKYESEETDSTYDYDDDTSSITREDTNNSIEDAGIPANEKGYIKVALKKMPAAKACPADCCNKTVNKSSWQFQEVMKQVKQRGEATRGTEDYNSNSDHACAMANQQKLSDANEATKKQTNTSSTSDSDSWLKVSIGDDTNCVPSETFGKKRDTDAAISGDWELVGASDKDDDCSIGDSK